MTWALVTGGNRGLGLETCSQLLSRGFQVLVSARREADAVEAATLLGQGAVPLALDVSNRQGAEAALRFLERRPPLDVLVNNAGVSLPGFDVDIARRTLEVNTWGAARLTDLLRPKLSNSARVVMVSSGLGSLSHFSGRPAALLGDPALGREQLHELGRLFLEATPHDALAASGFPRSAYSVSKALVNAATRILSREWGANGPRINAVCPGWVRTRMGGAHASCSVHEGASGIVWAATLGPGAPTGRFFRNGIEIEW